MEATCDRCTKFDRRILVTGGAGFIGSHVVLFLVNKYPNYFIVNLDKLDYSASLRHVESVKDATNYKFIQGDICEPEFVRYILQEEKVDTILHFAAQSHVDLSFWSSLDFTHTNVYGSHVLINAAYEADIGLFIHVSTDEVYGGNSKEVLLEGAKLNPTNPYSASKAAAENMVLSYWEAFKGVSIQQSWSSMGPAIHTKETIYEY